MSNAFNQTWLLVKEELANQKLIERFEYDPREMDRHSKKIRAKDPAGNPILQPPISRHTQMGREKELAEMRETGKRPKLNPIRISRDEDDKPVGKPSKFIDDSPDYIKALRRLRERERNNIINFNHPRYKDDPMRGRQRHSHKVGEGIVKGYY